MKSVESFSTAPQQQREREGNIICPLIWQAVGFKLSATWNTGISFRAETGEEAKLGFLPNGCFVRSVPTAVVDMGYFKSYQIRIHDDEDNWGVSQYLNIMKQADVEKVGISNVLFKLQHAKPDEYYRVALPTVKFRIVSLTELMGRNFETKLYGFAELNADGFFTRDEVEHSVTAVRLEKAHISFDEPLIVVFSQQKGFGQPLEHILVGFVSDMTK